MIAVIIAHINYWYKYCSRHTLITVIASSAAGCIIPLFQPDLFLPFVFMVSCYTVMHYAKNYQHNMQQLIEWAVNNRIGTIVYFAGYLISMIIVFNIHLLIFTPVLIMMHFIWGADLSFFLKAYIPGFFGMLLFTLSLVIINQLFVFDKENYVEYYIIVIVNIITLVIGILRNFNPFFLIWSILNNRSVNLMFYSFIWSMIILIIIIAEYFLLKKEIEPYYEK